MGMRDIAVNGNVSLKIFFRLFNLPDSQSRGIVDLLLKKNRHESNIRLKPDKIGSRFPLDLPSPDKSKKS